jgi:hypothetical protein
VAPRIIVATVRVEPRRRPTRRQRLAQQREIEQWRKATKKAVPEEQSGESSA